MRRRILATMIAGAMALSMSTTAFAAGWVTDENGRKWQLDDGNSYMNTWMWIDADEDGMAECYYFDENGYVLADTESPDGYQVNEDGAWTVDGIVQTQELTTQTTAETETQAVASTDQNQADNYSGVYMVPTYDGGTQAVTITYDASANSLSLSWGPDRVLYYEGVFAGETWFECDPLEGKGGIAFSAPGLMSNYYGKTVSIARQ